MSNISGRSGGQTIVPLNLSEALLFANQTDDQIMMMIRPPEFKFNGKGENLKAFMKHISVYSELHDIQSLFDIPDPIITRVTTKDFLTNYSIIPIADCRAHIQLLYTTSVEQSSAHPQDDDQMMFDHVEGLLTKDFERQMKSQPQLYTICGPHRPSNQSGLLFLKLILSEAERDTRVAVNLLRLKTLTLVKKITELQDNIVEFNLYERSLIHDFIKYDASYDKDKDCLHTYVLWSYEKVNDERFVRFINDIMYNHDELKTPSLDTFMTRAENHYNNRILRGNWKPPTKQDLEIAAIKAILESLNMKSVATKNSGNNGGARNKARRRKARQTR